MPWGSYGEMLWQGIYCYDKDTNSHMIFRTGAFCPSIYRSQYNRESPVLIVKEDVLQYIIESNLTGFVLHESVITHHRLHRFTQINMSDINKLKKSA